MPETYRICSDKSYDARTDAFSEKFFIDKRIGVFFKRWKYITGSFEVTDESNVISSKEFTSYDMAEKYLLQKYSHGYRMVKSGNTYWTDVPNMWI